MRVPKKMKRLVIAAMIMALGMAGYSCASKCVSVPPPGGYSYDQAPERGEEGEKK
jgi:hypothetical protein